MAKDYHIQGHNTLGMAKVADQFRKLLGVDDAEYIDIISILEFGLVKIRPNFRLVIKRDQDFPEDALTDFEKDQILVRESVYIAAHEGDTRSRMILTHELGHYLLHGGKGNLIMHKTRDGAYESIKGLDSTQSTEDQADMFAAHFLVKPSLAFELKDDSISLSQRTGVPPHIAKTIISAAKRPGLRGLTQKRNKTFLDEYQPKDDADKPSLF